MGLLGARFFHFGQVTHQATLAARGVILVNDAFFSCFVQGTDGCQGCCTGVFWNAFLDGGAGVLNIGARFTSEQAVAQATLMILFDAFDSRFGISQLDPPKSLS